MQPKISIIVPVYNASHYLEKNLNSICSQEYKNYEVLLIDDGSTDNSFEICQSFEKEYQNVKAFHRTNQGVSKARNFGISISTGDYIAFVDSDDIVKYNYLKSLVDHMRRDVDLTIGGYEVSGSKKILNDTLFLEKNKNKRIDSLTAIKYLLSIDNDNEIYGYIWRCLFKKSIIDNSNLKFRDVKMSEDFIFLIEYLLHSDSITVFPQCIYTYTINPSSTTVSYIPSLSSDLIQNSRFLKKVVVDAHPALQDDYIGSICNAYLVIVQNEARNSKKNIFVRTRYLHHIKNLYFKKYIFIGLKKKLPFRKKLYISLLLFHLNFELLYLFLYQIKAR